MQAVDFRPDSLRKGSKIALHHKIHKSRVFSIPKPKSYALSSMQAVDFDPDSLRKILPAAVQVVARAMAANQKCVPPLPGPPRLEDMHTTACTCLGIGPVKGPADSLLFTCQQCSLFRAFRCLRSEVGDGASYFKHCAMQRTGRCAFYRKQLLRREMLENAVRKAHC